MSPWAALVLLCAAVAAQDSTPTDLFVERKLATLPDDVKIPEQSECVSVGAGGKRVVWTQVVAPRATIVVLDGVPCKPIEAFRSLESLTPGAALPWAGNLWGSLWSVDGKHVAWLGVRGSKKILFVDGVESEPWHEILGSIALSADWKRIGYAAGDGTKTFAVVDGKRLGAEFDEVLWVSISADGSRVGYQARQGKKYFMVVDGRVVEGKYREFRGPWFSPDGKRMAFMGRSDKGEHLVVDGVEGPRYDVVQFLRFSPDGGRVAYKARTGPTWHVIVDGVQGPGFEDVEGYSLRFSPDGKRFAYPVEGHLILDGQIQPKKDTQFNSLTFSPDGKRLAYFRRMDLGGQQPVVDGTPYPAGSDHLVFSPSGRHFAATDYRSMIIVDRTRGPEFDAVLGPPVFSPDDKKVAYPVRRGREILWKVDDVVSELGPGERAAVEELGKVRSVLENSESYQVRVAVKSVREDRPADPPMQHRLSVWVKGNRVRMTYEDAATGSRLELASDGAKVETIQTDGTGKMNPIRSSKASTDDYREGLSSALSRGVPLTYWFMGGGKLPRIVDVKPLETADGTKGLSYLLLFGESEMVGRVSEWHDPKTFILAKRTVKFDAKILRETFTETFEDVKINPQIPDEAFNLPAEKK
jgi:hypothetical protein